MNQIHTGIKNTDLYVIVEGRGTAEYCSDLYAGIDNLLKEHENVNRILFEMSKAEYVDSSFIGLILSTRKKLPTIESPTWLLNPSSKIIDIFKLMGLDNFIPSFFDNNLVCDCGLKSIDQKLENSISDIKLLLESHQEIIATSSENQKRFALVEKVFQQELQKKEQQADK